MSTVNGGRTFSLERRISTAKVGNAIAEEESEILAYTRGAYSLPPGKRAGGSCSFLKSISKRARIINFDPARVVYLAR